MVPIEIEGPHRAPLSAEECRLVREELHTIVSSHYFRNSRRYPAFLTYIVEKTIRGEIAEVKERTIGIEVLGRPADYDTNTDPTVRNTASEVRKRLALYHAETSNETGVEIYLPLGSYYPEIRLKVHPQGASEENTASETQHVAASPVPVVEQTTAVADSRKTGVKWLWWAVPLFVAVAGAGAWWAISHAQKTPVEKLWNGFLNPAQTVLIGIPRAPAPDALNRLFGQGNPPRTDSISEWVKDNPDIAVEDVAAIMHASQPLMERSVPFHFQMDTVITLADLRDRPVVLIGGPSNSWTMKLLAPLRFHFSTDRVLHIEDTQNPQSRKWAYVVDDYQSPRANVLGDCAIVARFHDPTTGGVVMILAGAGRNGTEAAGEFVTSNLLLQELNKRLPHGWENQNLEVVLKTKVIDGKTGSPSIEAVNIWQ